MDIIVFGEDSTEYASRRLSTHTHKRTNKQTNTYGSNSREEEFTAVTWKYVLIYKFKTQGHSCTQGVKVAGRL